MSSSTHADVLHDRDRRRAAIGLGICLFVAAALRIGWAWSVDVDPRRNFHFDMTWYDLAAQTFLEGRVLTGPDGVATAFWPPGYPALLGAAYALFGASLRTAQALNVALGCVSCGLTYLLALRIGGGSPAARRTALGAAAILAVFPGYVFFAPLTLSENAFVALMCGILLVLARLQRKPGAGFRDWFGFGVLLGVAMLTRGAASLFVAVPIGLWWFETRSWQTVARRGAAVAIGAIVVVAPWTIRNSIALGTPVLVSTSIGMALSYAHSPVADGSESLRMMAYRNDLMSDLQDLPNPQREVREMQRGVQSALGYAISHPLRELSLIPRRLFYLFQHDHAGLDWAIAAGEGTRPTDGALRAIAAGFFFSMSGLAAIGAWTRRREPGVQLAIATVAYFAALHGVLFVGNPRYHAPLYPVIAVLAAIGAPIAWGRVRGVLPRYSR